MMFARALPGAEKPVDENCRVFFSDIHIAADRTTLSRNVNMAENFKAASREVLALPVRYREPVVLFYFHEMDVAAAARTMGLPEGTLKARLSRARGLLRRRFPQLEAEQVGEESAIRDAGKEA